MPFPKNFFWGTSTASHQIEGNTANDWTTWEQNNAERLAAEAPKNFSKRSPRWEEVRLEATNPHNYISALADDSYNRWQEDIALLESVGVNAYRFSVEWSRVEPKPGVYNEQVIAHYVDIIKELKSKNIEPFVTILHRTVPIWFTEQGGWANANSVKIFSNYADKLRKDLGTHVTYWTILNEPVLNVGGGFVAGNIPPCKKNIFAALLAYRNMIRAHRAVYTLIKHTNPTAYVGCAHAAVYAEAEHGRWYNQLLVDGVHYFANWKFLNGIRKFTDFIGIQYYTRGVIGFRKSKLFIPLPGEIAQPGPASDMGQEIYPAGLYKYALLVWKRYKKPIIVTENGVADQNDQYRAQYITDHVEQVRRLISDGVDMRGYFYWSLLDNFEWDKGFWPKFGLASVNVDTKARTLRTSAQTYATIINNAENGKN